MTEATPLGTAHAAKLSASKAKLLEKLLGRSTSRSGAIRKYARDEGATVAASSAQQRLWFIDQLEECGATYNIPVALELRGRLHESALREALNALVERHEALRTVFEAVEGELRQSIAATGRFGLQTSSLLDVPADHRADTLRSHALSEAKSPFDLRTGPLIRGHLLQLEPERHVLLLTMHHIVSDGWSLGVFIRELAETYQASSEGRAPRLPALSIQYADYAQWQRSWLQGDSQQQQVAYWRTRLAGINGQLDLPTDRKRPATQSYRGATVGVVIDAQLTSQLKGFAQAHDMTLFMVLYAAWTMLLARLSGQEEVIVGTPIANRRRPEFEGLIGF
ncbi:MAG TPA: condensation domain-containing protein, partial [Steroidobacter sp.]